MRTLYYIPARMDLLRSTLARHAQLLLNASSLVTSAAGTAILGFAYWWVAARFFSLESVGLAAAAVSIMGLISLVAQSGLSTLLVGERLVEIDKGFSLSAAALIVAFVSASLLGILFVAIANAISLNLGAMTASPVAILCFVLGCGITAFSGVLNSVFLGLLRGTLQMYHNLAFSFIKLALLMLLAAQYGSGAKEDLVFATWVGGQVAASCAFVLLLKGLNAGKIPKPRFAALRPLARAFLSHHVLDLVIQTPSILMPFLVTVILSPAVNAAFNAGWMMLRIPVLLPSALSTVLFAIGHTDREAFKSRLRLSLYISAAGGVFVAIFFALFSDFVLGIFNAEYATIAASSLQLLGLSFFGIAIRCFYLAIERLNGWMLHASVVFAFGGAAELLFAYVGAYSYGLVGLSIGWTLAVTLHSLYMVKAVVNAAYPRSDK